MAILLGILLTILAIRLALNPKNISNATTVPDQLADRIDLNTATTAELAAIPGLGEKRAAAIVQFRTQFQSRHPNQPAFRRPTDLEQIPGIGAAIAENLEPYLTFPPTSK